MADQAEQLLIGRRQQRLVRFGRSRFSWVLLSMVLMVSVGIGLTQRRSSEAASTTTVSGRVYDADTNYGIPNVTLSLCHNITVVTNASGEWSIALPVGSSICALYQSGAPSTLITSDAVNLPATATRRDIYQYQITGMNCYNNTTDVVCYANSRIYDRAVDSGYDLRFKLQVPYTPPPSPSPTPMPTVVPTTAPKVTAAPVVKTTPAVTATPRPATTGGQSGSKDDQAPGVPENLVAKSAETNALVTLTWNPAHDNVGISAYELERSIGGETWEQLRQDLTATSYQDTTVVYDTTYMYRVRARDAAGNTSAYATAQARTAVFVTNTSKDSASSYTSDDGTATSYALPGTFSGDAQCSVVVGGWSTLKLDAESAILAGPYQLLCKDAQGNVISAFAHGVRWTITPRQSNLKLGAPQLYQVGSDGKPKPLTAVTYDSKTKAYSYTQRSNERLIVLASQQSSTTAMTAVVVSAVVILLLAAGTFISLQRKRIAMYRNYVRDKYYNL